MNEIAIVCICCLQLYTEYISNFDKALKLLDESCKKNRAFGELVREFEVCNQYAYTLYNSIHLISSVTKICTWQYILPRINVTKSGYCKCVTSCS